MLSVLVFYFARPPAGWWVRWVGIAGALCLLVLSKSATGIVVFAVMVATLPLYRLVRSKLTFAIPVLIVLGVAAVGSGFLFYMILPSLLGMLQRGPHPDGTNRVVARDPALNRESPLARLRIQCLLDGRRANPQRYCSRSTGW